MKKKPSNEPRGFEWTGKMERTEKGFNYYEVRLLDGSTSWITVPPESEEEKEKATS